MTEFSYNVNMFKYLWKSLKGIQVQCKKQPYNTQHKTLEMIGNYMMDSDWCNQTVLLDQIEVDKAFEDYFIHPNQSTIFY